MSSRYDPSSFIAKGVPASDSDDNDEMGDKVSDLGVSGRSDLEQGGIGGGGSILQNNKNSSHATTTTHSSKKPSPQDTDTEKQTSRTRNYIGEFIQKRKSSKKKKKKQQKQQPDWIDHEAAKRKKRCVAITIVIAVVTVSSAIIGFAIPYQDHHDFHSNTNTHYFIFTDPISPLDEREVPHVKNIKTGNTNADTSGNTSWQYNDKNGNENNAGEEEEEELLLLAESILQKCSDESMDSPSGRFECQTVCQDHLCCFEDGSDNCQEEEGNMCSVYAACEEIVLDLKLEAEVEKWDRGGIVEDVGEEESEDEANSWDEEVDEEEESADAEEEEEESADEEEEEEEEDDESAVEEDGEEIWAEAEDAMDEDAEGENDPAEEDVMDAEIDISANEDEGDEEDEMDENVSEEARVTDVNVDADIVNDEADLDNGQDVNEIAEENTTLLTLSTQELLQIAENINQSCSESSINTDTGKLNCQELCDDHFCCFDDEVGCSFDDTMSCIVYAGCRGMYLELFGEEEDENRL